MRDGASTIAPQSAMVLIVIVAAALRIAYVCWYPQLPICEDCRMYDEVGTNLAAGRGFVGGFGGETYHRPTVHDPTRPEIGIGPIYPAFLAAIYRVAGHRYAAVRVVQALIGAAMLIPLFALVNRACGDRAALTAAAVAAVYPALVFYCGFLVTETLSTALLLFALWAIDDAWVHPTAGAFVRTGLIAGVAILLREEFLIVLAAAAALLWWRTRARHAAATIAAIAVIAALTIAPWTIRNYRVFGRFIMVSAHSGDTLYLSVKGWTDWKFGDPELQRLSADRTYLEQADALRRAALQEIAAHPVAVAVRRVAQFPDFWLSSHTSNVAGVTGSFRQYISERRIVPVAVKAALLAVNTVVILVGIAGLARAAASPAVDAVAVTLLIAPIVSLALVHLALFAAPRYQIPMLPFVIAGVGVLSMRRAVAA